MSNLVMSIQSFLLMQEVGSVLGRIWYYLTLDFHLGQLTVSVVSVVFGAIVLTITIIVSSAGSKLLERRIAARRHIDPGLRYTIARLVK